MAKNLKKGLFITLEGNEGCGKSTQIKLLADRLRRDGRNVFVTREPGGTRAGDGIREVLLDAKNERMTPEAETLLYMASRAQLVEEVLKIELKRRDIVLSDRWLDATVAYQGYGAGVDVKWIEELGRRVTQGVKPDVTLFLDLSVSVGLRRAKKRHKADRMELKKEAFHRKVRNGFLKIAQKEPRRFRRIPISPGDSIEKVHSRIVGELRRVLG